MDEQAPGVPNRGVDHGTSSSRDCGKWTKRITGDAFRFTATVIVVEEKHIERLEKTSQTHPVIAGKENVCVYIKQ